MRIAIITNGYFPVPPTRGGAVETLVYQLIEQNENAEGVEFVIFSCFDEDAYSISMNFNNSSFKFIEIPTIIRTLDSGIYFIAKNILRKQKHMSYRFILQRLYFIHSTGKLLRDDPVDRVVFENHPVLLRALRPSNNKSRYEGKYFYHMHNVFDGFFGCRKELLECRRIIGVSEYALAELEKLCETPLPSEQLAVLKNRVDEHKFNGAAIDDKQRDEIRKRHSISRDAKIILFAGRLVPEKGALELIEAFKKLTESETVLLILGSYYFGSEMTGEYESRIKRTAASLGNRIIFTGYVEHDATPLYYAIADVVVAPSIGSDSAPLAVIEPLTAGRPLISTKVGGIPEYATDGNDAILLDVDDNLVDNLTHAMDDILSGKKHLHQMRDDAYWSSQSFYDGFIEEVTA